VLHRGQLAEPSGDVGTVPKINGAEVRAQADVRRDGAEEPVAAKAEGLEVVEPGNAIGDGARELVV